MASVYQTMLNGGPYHSPEEECGVRAGFVAERLKVFNQTSPSDPSRHALLKEMLLAYEPGYICSPIQFEYGHLELGPGIFINWDCMFLDNARISIARNVAIGPRCVFTTVAHDLDPAKRAHFDANGTAKGGIGWTKPITIEEGVWIGASVTVLPGVTIGRGSTIGAGSIVTKDVPPSVVAFGNPCRVQRQV